MMQKRAGMIAAFGDLDVCGVVRRREDPRRKVGVEIGGKGGRGARVDSQLSFDGAKNVFDFAGANHRVHFGICSRFVAVASPGIRHDVNFFRRGQIFYIQPSPESYRIDSFWAGAMKAARIDDEHLGFFRSRREFVPMARENAHHDLAITRFFGHPG